MGEVEPIKYKLSVENSFKLFVGLLINTMPIVVGGPKSDCPISISTIPTFRPCLAQKLANNRVQILLPVSVDPNTNTAPLSFKILLAISIQSPGIKYSSVKSSCFIFYLLTSKMPVLRFYTDN
ncbi:hypothetical protein ES703_39580 [subsurface metagenome]